MSIFSKFVKERFVISKLQQSDGSIIELKFKPMGLSDQGTFKKFATMNTESIEEITDAGKTFCQFLAKQCVSAKLINGDVESDEKLPTEAEFLELFECDTLTFNEIINDFTPKKAQVESKKQ